MKKVVLAVALCAPVLMGADGSGGCDGPLPTSEQIKLNLPEEVLNCPYAPKSPGANASREQTAIYLLQLHAAWKNCNGDVRDVNRLYRKWQAEVAARESKGK